MLMLAAVTSSNGKLYIYGGSSRVSNGSSPSYDNNNHYLRIVDFTKPMDLIDVVMTADEIPVDIRISSYGAFWGDEERLYVLGGLYQGSPFFLENGTLLIKDWSIVDYTGSTVVTYDIASKKWDKSETLQPVGDSKVENMFGSGYVGWNSVQKKGYVYAGSDWAGYRKHFPNQTSYEEAAGKSSGLAVGSGNLLSFETDNLKWRNSTTNESLTTSWSESGQFVFLPGTETESGGIAVAVGGRKILDLTDEQRNPKNEQMETMGRVLVYDSGNDVWYSQETTVEDGKSLPKGRMHFCAVAVSAADNSSHNVYMYGGEPAGTRESFSDIWVLTIPRFHWIPLDVGNSLGRKGLGCAKVGDRYMVAYGGSSYDKCDQENYGLAMFDLNELRWTTKYEGPGKNSYAVPDPVVKAIGGNGQGGATKTSPSKGWNTAALETVFKKQTTTWTGPTPGSSSPTSSGLGGSSPTSSGVAKSSETNVGVIAGGFVGGIIGLAVIVGIIWFVLRRRRRVDQGVQDYPPSYQPHKAAEATELDAIGPLTEMPDPRRQTAYELEAHAYERLDSKTPRLRDS
jgi:hypothetical protein